MDAMCEKDYLVIVQCDIVMERCSGYFCEKAFHERSGGFSDYPADRAYRTLYMTCGGCCGRGLQRKLSNLIAKISEKEGVTKERIVVHLATCMTKDNHHGPKCPFLGYIKKLVSKLGLDLREDTRISQKSEARRKAGEYSA
jgi:predicted metal-binding protein